jgi:hypothetical protein
MILRSFGCIYSNIIIFHIWEIAIFELKVQKNDGKSIRHTKER